MSVDIHRAAMRDKDNAEDYIGDTIGSHGEPSPEWRDNFGSDDYELPPTNWCRMQWAVFVSWRGD